MHIACIYVRMYMLFVLVLEEQLCQMPEFKEIHQSVNQSIKYTYHPALHTLLHHMNIVSANLYAGSWLT